MKVHKLMYTAIFLLGIFAASCGNDPIFFIISSETPPIPPLIPGAPTNMVVFERAYNGSSIPLLFVASGKLHWYGGDPANPKWDSSDYGIPQPSDRIISLAVTTNRLYALCLHGNSLNATLYYIEHNSDKWTEVQYDANDYPLIQSIYADPTGSRLFASARTTKDGTNYALLHLDLDNDTLRILWPNTAMLTGALSDGSDYYLCTQGDGIFQVSSGNAVTPLGDKLTFVGMIKLGNGTIIAVERKGGALYEVGGGAVTQMHNSSGGSIETGKYATGALALWEDPVRNIKLLVAGIQGGLYSSSTSSYTNGYVEFELNFSSGAFEIDSPRHDSSKLQTVINTNQYTTSLGKHPVNHLYQAPNTIDINMTFFASTQAAGLWSYRDRHDKYGWQWNAEN